MTQPFGLLVSQNGGGSIFGGKAPLFNVMFNGNQKENRFDPLEKVILLPTSFPKTPSAQPIELIRATRE